MMLYIPQTNKFFLIVQVKSAKILRTVLKKFKKQASIYNTIHNKSSISPSIWGYHL